MSTIGQLVLWCHERATVRGLVKEQDDEATAILAAIQSGEGHSVGIELRNGHLRSARARTIFKRALREFKSIDTCVYYVDTFGYDYLIVRSLITHHYLQLSRAPITSDEYAIYQDLNHAYKQATEQTQLVIKLLAAGYGPLEIKDTYKLDASRLIRRAVAELARILEGVTNG